MKSDRFHACMPLALVLMCMALVFTGCSSSKDNANSIEESSFDESTASQYVPYDLKNEPPIMDYYANIICPDFFNDEQAKVYKQCLSIFGLFNGAPYNIDAIPLSEPKAIHDVRETITYDGIKYVIANGRYTTWDSFYTMCINVFTDDYFAELNAFEISQPDQTVKKYSKFMDYNDRLYFHDAESGSTFGYDREKNPDDFELISKSDELLEFYIVAHYYSDGNNKDDTKAIKLPCSMIKTENGWRINSFTSPSYLPFELDKQR